MQSKGQHMGVDVVRDGLVGRPVEPLVGAHQAGGERQVAAGAVPGALAEGCAGRRTSGADPADRLVEVGDGLRSASSDGARRMEPSSASRVANTAG